MHFLRKISYKPCSGSSRSRLSAAFTRGAGRSHNTGFVAAHLRYKNTASWAAALPLQQSRPVNNPGFFYGLFIKSAGSDVHVPQKISVHLEVGGDVLAIGQILDFSG